MALGLGECLGQAYFRASYEDGIAQRLVTDNRMQFEANEPLLRIPTVFLQD